MNYERDLILKLVTICIVSLQPGIAFPSNQINISFSFNNSNHLHSLYACNAGIITNISTNPIYFDTISENLGCVPGTLNCQEINLEGMELQNFIIAITQPWDQVAPITPRKVSSCVSGSGTCLTGVTMGNGVLFAVNSDDVWMNQLTSISFNFGSMLRSAQFFVDVCYRAPRDVNYEVFRDGLEQRWVLNTSITTTTLLSGDTPFPPSTGPRLKNRTSIYCDVQGDGSQIFAKDSNNDYTSVLRDLVINDVSTDFTADFSDRSALSNVPASGTLNRHTNLKLRKGQINLAPRFCLIRYEFQDTPTTQIRTHTEQGSQVTLFSNFEILP